MSNPFESIESQISELKNLVISLNEKLSKSEKPTNEVLTLSECCEMLGYKRNSLYNLVHKNAIPYRKRNGKLFFVRKEILEWVSEGKPNFVNMITNR